MTVWRDVVSLRHSKLSGDVGDCCSRRARHRVTLSDDLVTLTSCYSSSSSKDVICDVHRVLLSLVAVLDFH